MTAFILGCAVHTNSMGIFKVFSIIPCFLADRLACHHISLALNQARFFWVGGERSPEHIIWLPLAFGNDDLDIKKSRFAVLLVFLLFLFSSDCIF